MAGNLAKLLSLSSKTSAPRSVPKGGPRYQGSERIESWYRIVVYGMKRLEQSVKPEAPSFSMDSLKIGVKLIQLMHSQVHSIMKDLWLPVRATATAQAGAGAGAGAGTGDDVLNIYLEMNKTVLDVGILVKEGLGRLETYEMSLEHALISMASAVDGLPKCHADATRDLECNSSEVPFKKLMEACSTELAGLESKKRLDIWEKVVSMMEGGPLGGSGNGDGGGGRLKGDRLNRQQKARIEILKKKGSLPRSLSMVLPNNSAGRIALDITLLLLDAESVTVFISCMLLWVLSESSDKFKNVFDLVILKLAPTVAYDKNDWLVSITKLRDKILKAEATGWDHSGATGEQQPRVNSLGEFEHLRNTLHTLYAKIEEIGLKRETAEGSAQSQKSAMEDGSLSLLLEKSKESLAELKTGSEELAQESSNAHLDILSSRREILDCMENQFVRSSTF